MKEKVSKFNMKFQKMRKEVNIKYFLYYGAKGKMKNGMKFRNLRTWQ